MPLAQRTIDTGLCTVLNGQYMCIVSFFCLKFYCLRWDHCFCFILYNITGDPFKLNMSPIPVLFPEKNFIVSFPHNFPRPGTGVLESIRTSSLASCTSFPSL